MKIFFRIFLFVIGLTGGICQSRQTDVSKNSKPDVFAHEDKRIRKDHPVYKMQEFHQRNGLPGLFYKIARQRQIRIGYIGGSITEAGSGWRDLTFDWFRLKYPQTAFYQINAAIGGTGSGLGVFRMERDLLAGKPDLVFVEFAVNDSGTAREELLRSVEGMIRKIWAALPECEICFVYTAAEAHCKELAEGKQQQSVTTMEELADYYGIPSIHLGLEVVRLYVEGKLTLTAEASENARTIVFTSDRTHPLSESGHPIYAGVATRYLERMSKKPAIVRRSLPVPYIADNWQNARMIDVSQTSLSGKWEKLPEESAVMQQFSRYMPSLYRLSPGAVMRFKFNGSVLGFYDCIGPGSGTVEVTVDGQKHVIRRFDQWCSNYRKHNFFIGDLTDGVHEVEVRVLDSPVDKASIMLLKNIVITDPERYAALDWYPANIMIAGEMLH